MSDIYFLKDNEGTSNNKPDMEVALSKIITKFGASSLKFLSKKDVSIINDRPSKWEIRVIVFIKNNELSKTLNLKSGFYVIDEVSKGLFIEKISPDT